MGNMGKKYLTSNYRYDIYDWNLENECKWERPIKEGDGFMATKVLIDDRYLHRGAAFVSINPKLSRLLLYKKGYELIKKHYGRDLEYVQIKTDDERKNLFWLKPCDSDASGSRKMDQTSPSTRTLSIRALFNELKWKPDGTVRLPLEWDSEEEAARLDISKAEEKKKAKTE